MRLDTKEKLAILALLAQLVRSDQRVTKDHRDHKELRYSNMCKDTAVSSYTISCHVIRVLRVLMDQLVDRVRLDHKERRDHL